MEPIIPVLQTAISPAILISGVGLLLLTMTNRLGRAIDRARLLDAALPPPGDPARVPVEAQLRVLWQRARTIRAAIILASSSAVAAALLVIVIFLSALLPIDPSLAIAGLFMLAMGFLLASLLVFIHDINQSLAALRLELAAHGQG